MTPNDAELLRLYLDEQLDTAFASLVARHVDLVYGVALRQVHGDAHLARDVAQTAFIALARQAPSLRGRPTLAGWLHRTAQFQAVDAVRAASRRRVYEEKAQAHAHTMENNFAAGGSASPDWERLRPTLDQVIGKLAEADRDAVVLRFFEGKSYADVGMHLAVPENTARMRVARALDKLHARLTRRGITSSTAALAVVLGQPAIAAPAGMAAAIATAALQAVPVASTVAAATGTATAAGSTGGALAFMSTGKLVGGLAAILALLGIGASVVATRAASDAERLLSETTARQAGATARLAALEQRTRASHDRRLVAEAENRRLLAAAAAVPAQAIPEAPLSSVAIQARLDHARNLVKQGGDPAEALRELLWCFDVGMRQTSMFSGLRVSVLVATLGDLATSYPPARAALEERRAQARAAMLADSSDTEAASDFGAINRTLKDNAATLAVLDQLPAGDRRRSWLASDAFGDLLTAQRYADALEGRPYRTISAMFEQISDGRLPPRTPVPAEALRQQRASAIAWMADSIEVVAGADHMDQARALAERLLAYDNTPATRALIQQHAARAGQPGLLDPSTSGSKP